LNSHWNFSDDTFQPKKKKARKEKEFCEQEYKEGREKHKLKKKRADDTLLFLYAEV